MHQRPSPKKPRFSLYVCGFSALTLVLSQSVAEAQSLRLDRFRSAERPDDAFSVRRLGTFGHLRFSANAVADYARNALIVKRSPSSSDELQSIVAHELTLKVDLSLALYDRWIVLAGFDAVPLLKGPALEPGLGSINATKADGAGFGDLSLGARARLLGQQHDLFALGLQTAAIFPTAGRAQSYRGESHVAIRPELIAELRTKPVRVTANAGVTARKKVQAVDRQLGSELVYGVAVAVPLHARLELLGELTGAFDLNHFGAQTSTGVEWLLGAKANTQRGVYFSAAGGTGMTHGVGTPDARALVQLGYLTPLPKPIAHHAPAKREPPPPPSDSDHDGVFDGDDSCDDVAEDRDDFADQDGCPDLDNDGDDVADVDDACDNAAEDRDDFADEDGCPDPDNDGDGVPDYDDACRNEPGLPEHQGCTAQTASGSLTMFDQVQFENNRELLSEDGDPALESLRVTLEQHPEIKRLRILGHSDGVGGAPYNMRLSRARTAAVVSWLLAHQVAKARLQAFGCGELYTIADDVSLEGRAKNRRVEFQVVEPLAPGAQPRLQQGCTRLSIK